MKQQPLRLTTTAHWKRGLLFALLAAQSAAVLSVGRHGGFQALAARLQQAPPRPPHVATLHEWQLALARDPKPGTRLPAISLTDSEGGHLAVGDGARPGGILFINSCTNCVAAYVASWDALQRDHPEFDLYVVPASPDPELIRQFKQWHHLSVRFVVNGQLPLIRACNPYFLPRIYLYHRSGQLTYVQPSSVATEAALAEIRAALADEPRVQAGAQHRAGGR